jgi:uncharacterized protein
LTVEFIARNYFRQRLRMRDGVQLDTWIWLPVGQEEAAPAILMRTPYGDALSPWAGLGMSAYCDAGYAVVVQLVRGVGTSDGKFSFNDPLDRLDGYDTIEWIADQAWCNGAVGMDGSSYGAMTQLNAAIALPPHLRCIVPAAPAADFFHEVPYFGGVFARQHSLGWAQAIESQNRERLTPGLLDEAALLGTPSAWRTLLSRPATTAGDSFLSGDKREHYHDLAEHSTFDGWWSERTLGREDFAKINIPMLLISGNFDLGAGAHHVWREIQQYADSADKYFIIGPWDHGQCYSGGAAGFGPYEFGVAGEKIDLPALRLAFFDRYLKGLSAPQSHAVTVFFSGANEWLCFDSLQPPGLTPSPIYLHSEGRANSSRGDGRLSWDKPTSAQPADSFLSDPTLPFVPVVPNLDSSMVLDLRELERMHDVLVYTSDPIDEAMTLFGEFETLLHMTADTLDCDVVCQLAEVRGESSVRLSLGALRLRFRQGMDREVNLTPGTPTLARVRMTYVGHRVAAGSRLRLIVGSSMFPFLDPNPNTGEPIGSATRLQIAQETIFHDPICPSHIALPILRQAHAA